jgi:hypothetical protein
MREMLNRRTTRGDYGLSLHRSQRKKSPIGGADGRQAIPKDEEGMTRIRKGCTHVEETSDRTEKGIISRNAKAGRDEKSRKREEKQMS